MVRPRVLAVLLGAAGAVLVGVALSLQGALTVLLVLVLLAAVVAMAAVVLWRFELLVPVVLGLRASMDYFGGGGAVDPALAITGVFALASAVWLLVQRRNRQLLPLSILSKALLVFFVVCAMSAVSSSQPAQSLLSSVKVGSGVVMFLVLEQYLGRHPEKVRRVVLAVLLSLVPPGLVALQQAATGTGIEVSELVPIARVQGTFVHPSPFATYLVIVLALLLPLVAVSRGWWRVGIGVAAAGSMGLLLLTYTRSAWFAVVLVALVVAFRVNRRLLLLLPPAVVAVVLFVPSVTERFSDLGAAAPAPGAPANSLAWRLEYWHDISVLNFSTPFTGIGFEMTRRVTPAQLDPHNIWVQAWVELGVFGLMAMAFLVYAVFRTVRQRLATATTAEARALATAAACVAIGLLMLSVGENLLTQSFVYWYAAAAATFGVTSVPAGTFGRRDAVTDPPR